VNNGSADICLDFDFTGGKLFNGNRWQYSWYQSYHTDSFNGGDSLGGPWTDLGRGCTDSGSTSPASAIAFANVYSNRYTANASYQNKYRVSTRTRYTAKGMPVAHVVSLFGNKTGVNFPGISCEKVFIDMNNPFFLLPVTAGTGTNAEVYINFPLLPYQKSLEEIPIYVQGVWSDSSTGAMKFTYAQEVILPPMPVVFKRLMIYQPDPTKTTALYDTYTKKTVNDATWNNPLFRYAQ
jgi:hypothetical protein